MEIKRNRNKLVAMIIIILILMSFISMATGVIIHLSQSRIENSPKTFDLRTMSHDIISLNNLDQYDAIVGYENQIVDLSKSKNMQEYVEKGGNVIVAMDSYRDGSIGYIVEEINDDGIRVSNINGSLLLEQGDSIDDINFQDIDYTDVISEILYESENVMAANDLSGSNYDYGTQSKAIMRSYLINKKGNVTATMIITVLSHRLKKVDDVSAWAQMIYVDITPGSKTGIYNYQVAEFDIGIMEYGEQYLDHYVHNGEAKTITVSTTLGTDSQGNITASNTYSAKFTEGSLDIARRTPVIDGIKHTIWKCQPNERKSGRPFSAVVGGVYRYSSSEDVGTAFIYIQNVRVVSAPVGRSFEAKESKDSDQHYCASIIHAYQADSSARSFILGMSDNGENKGTIEDIDDGEYQVFFENAYAQRDKYGPIYTAVPRN